MIVVMHPDAAERQVQEVVERLSVHGFDVHRSSGLTHTVLGAIGAKPAFDHREIAALEGVATVYRVTPDESHAGRPAAWCGPAPLGGGRTVVFARLGAGVSPRRVEDLLARNRRVSGIVLGVGRSPDPVRVEECVAVAHSAGRGLLLEPTAPDASTPPGADGFVVSAGVTSRAERLAALLEAPLLLALRAPSRGAWTDLARALGARNAPSVVVVGSRRKAGMVDLAAASRAVAAFPVPVLLDSAPSGAQFRGICAAVVAGVSGVILHGPGTAWNAPAWKVFLAELASVASAVGRPLHG